MSEKEVVTVKKLVLLLSALLLALSLAAVAQEEQKEGKAAAVGKQDRVEGTVVRTSKDHSTITVRDSRASVEQVIHYDSATKFTAQEHASKKVEQIDPDQIKAEDRVICLGTYSKQGGFHATIISKRLSHSPPPQ